MPFDLENSGGETLHICPTRDGLDIVAWDGTEAGSYTASIRDVRALIEALTDWVQSRPPENTHRITTWGVPHGFGWSCACGAATRGGYAPTQTAAYAYGERHIRHALRKARASS